MKRFITIFLQVSWLMVSICLLSKGAVAQNYDAIAKVSFNKEQEVHMGSSSSINLELRDVSLLRALERIAEQADAELYHKAVLLPKKQVNLHLKGVSLKKALRIVLGGTSLKAVTSGGSIILKKTVEEHKHVQEIVQGTVTDANTGEALPSVNISVKGTTNGTFTDSEGHYNLDVSSLQDTLVFTFVGYQKQIVPINNRKTINVSMQSKSLEGQELVVVGYGKRKKSDLTGSVSSVNMEKTESIPTTNVAEMLRGHAAGLRVNLVDARPGGNSDIQIRGRNSILGGNSPLYIVDGVPQEDINDINSEDIASIEILKDASAQAIYGARASNGVILVTTKRGKAGEVKVDYHGYYTIQKLTKNFDLYSPEGFAQLRREAYRTTNNNEYLDDDVIFNEFERESLAKNRFVNWEDLILRNAKLTSHNLSLSGGTDKSKYFGSVRYFNQNGLIPTSGFKKGSFRLNFDQTISDKISVKADASFITDLQNIETSNLDFITISPLAKAYNDDGTLNRYPLGSTSTLVNPLWNIRESDNQVKNNVFNVKLVGEYDILKNLSYKLNTSLSRDNTDHGIYLSRLHGIGINTDGRATIGNSLRQEYLIENILNYDFQLGTLHQFDLTAVQSVNQIDYTHTQTIGTGFTNDILGYNGITDALNKLASRDGYRRRLQSYVGRLRYTFNNKYLLTLAGRSDGSSVFSVNHKRAFFPSAAVAWKINEEPFLSKNPNVNQLKLRLSYGSIGNEAIAPYQTLGIAESFPYVFGGTTFSGNLPGGSLPNPNLRWETSTTLNVGLDFGVLDNLFTGSVEYYNTYTRNLLVDVSLAGSSGYSSTITNGGESKNSGIEALLTANIIRNKDINWSLTGTFAANQNEILKTGLVDENGDPKDDIARNRFVGKPINVIYQKKFDGIFQSQEEIDNSAQKDQPDIKPGNIRVVDKNNDGVINEDDNYVFQADPNWYGSVSSTFNYKGFQLLADVYVVQGATKLNPYLSRYENGGTLQGSLNGIKVPYYTPEHPSDKWPRPQSTTQSYLYALAVQDASYIRLRTLTLSYDLPVMVENKIGLHKLQIYATGTNLFTITDYKSYSPEINPGAFPDAKKYTFGIKLEF